SLRDASPGACLATRRTRTLRRALLPQMEPRVSAVTPPRSQQRARRTPHDPAAAIAVAARSLGILALGGGTTRRFAGALPDPHGAARGSASLPGRRDRRCARRPHRFRRALSAFRPKPR